LRILEEDWSIAKLILTKKAVVADTVAIRLGRSRRYHVDMFILGLEQYVIATNQGPIIEQLFCTISRSTP
jgi:hypothetical protein